jgi:hypothetical protein
MAVLDRLGDLGHNDSKTEVFGPDLLEEKEEESHDPGYGGASWGWDCGGVGPNDAPRCLAFSVADEVSAIDTDADVRMLESWPCCHPPLSSS